MEYSIKDNVKIISGLYSGAEGTIEKFWPTGTMTNENVYDVRLTPNQVGMFKESELSTKEL
jgi:transcription antitermination factor NusG